MKSNSRAGRTFPAYLFGGRLRTSTLALIVAFAAIWWLYETYQPAAEPPPQVPASDVVPPGFVPDPSYTWVPRTDVQRRIPSTTTPTPTTPTTTSPTTTAPPGEETAPPNSSGEPTTPSTTAVFPEPAATTSPAVPPPSPAAPPP